MNTEKQSIGPICFLAIILIALIYGFVGVNTAYGKFCFAAADVTFGITALIIIQFVKPGLKKDIAIALNVILATGFTVMYFSVK